MAHVYDHRKCIVCGELYTPTGSRQSACGYTCRQKHKASIRKTHWSQEQSAEYLRRYRKTPRGRLNCKIAKLRNSAKNRGLEFSLTADWLQHRWNAQQGKCALTGFKMLWHSDKASKHGGGAEPFLLSVDRVDQTKGYTPENCRLVCHHANMMRGALTDEELGDWIDAIQEHLGVLPCR